MASIGQDEVWAAVRSVLEQSHPSGASHAHRHPSLSKAKVLNMSVPEFKSKNSVIDSVGAGDVKDLSKRIEDTKVKCLNLQKEANSALCQQIEDMEAKCLKMQKQAVLQKGAIIVKDRDLVDMSSEIAQLRLVNSVKDRDLEGLASDIAKLSNDLKHALEMNRRLMNGRKEIIVEAQDQLFQELEKQNRLKVREYNMAQEVKLAEDKIAKIEEEQKHERCKFSKSSGTIDMQRNTMTLGDVSKALHPGSSRCD